MKKSIAFFDFDGTITTKDTLLEFIKYSKGTTSFYLGFLLNSPYLVAYKLKIISNQAAKEKVLRFFFRKMPLETFNRHCQDFANQVIPGLLRPGAVEEIKKLKTSGVRIVIVSASPENWVGQWTRQIEAELLATRLEIDNNQLSGLIAGRNCHGQEKVRRIREMFKVEEYDEVYAYGDTNGDLPMLAIAHHKFYKPFR